MSAWEPRTLSIVESLARIRASPFGLASPPHSGLVCADFFTVESNWLTLPSFFSILEVDSSAFLILVRWLCVLNSFFLENFDWLLLGYGDFKPIVSLPWRFPRCYREVDELITIGFPARYIIFFPDGSSEHFSVGLSSQLIWNWPVS